MGDSYLSGGVYIEERNLSNSVVGAATNVGAYVGRSVWGQPNKAMLVTNEKEFVDMFGAPTDDNYEDFFTASGFLKFGQSFYFVRAVNNDVSQGGKNAECLSFVDSVSAGPGLYVEDWETYDQTFGSEKFRLYAKYPGEKGNTLFNVALVNKTAYDALKTNINNGTYAEVSACMPFIEFGPSTVHEYVVLVQANNSDGSASVVETFLVSDVPGAKDSQGNSMYVEQLINSSSKYIFVFNNTALTSDATPQAKFFGFRALSNGADGQEIDADIVSGYNLFGNPEEIQINYLIGGSHTGANIAPTISQIAQTRKDCFSLHDVDKTDVVNVSDVSTAVANCISYRNSEFPVSTSYSALYSNWLYVYDKYNDKNRWVPSSGYVAGIYANTANVADAWFAPAGFNRGVLTGVIKTAFNPNKAYRDQLYQNQVNPIVNFPGQGIVVWGQKTLQAKPSAFDRVNVRLLFNYMEVSVAQAAQFMVFEQNDNLLRAMFLNMVEPFLTNIKGRRGIYDFFVDVGDKVNTPEVIDANQFRAEIYIKPTRVAEFIVLRFNATRTSVDFSEFTA